MTAPKSRIAAQRARLAGGEISAVELAEQHLRQAESSRNLNILITETPDTALAQAQAADARRAKGEALPLDGIPIAVKDNYCTQGIRTTAGSKILETFIPRYESTVTQKLLAAGAVIVGKANMDEFAMGSSTETSHFGPTVNPTGVRLGHDHLVPGGSSGGSAAAVAGELASAALGTDTGGSIRQPASFCGVVGFKPTYGVCSRWGIVAYGSSLDQAGAFAHSVTDVAAVMDAIAGPDAKDTTSAPDRSYAFAQAIATRPKKLRIGFAKEVRVAGSTPETERVWSEAERVAAEMGAEIVEVSIPSFKYSLPAYYIIALSEASSNLARYDGVRYGYRTPAPADIADMYERSRGEGFGREVKRRILLGTYSLSAGYYDAYYLKAQRVRQKIAREFDAAFARVDALFMPTAPTAAFAIGSHTADPVQMYLEDVYTVPINLAGLPAISLPAAKADNGMPLGLQIVGNRFCDEAVLATAATAEMVLG